MFFNCLFSENEQASDVKMLKFSPALFVFNYLRELIRCIFVK